MTINTKEPCDSCGEELWRKDGEPRTCDNCIAADAARLQKNAETAAKSADTKAANIAAANDTEPQPVEEPSFLTPDAARAAARAAAWDAAGAADLAGAWDAAGAFPSDQAPA